MIRKLTLFASSIICLALTLAAAADDINPFFEGAPMLELHQTEPLAKVSVVNPTIFAPASGGADGHSFYIFGIGRLTEIRLEDGELIEHPIPFDRASQQIYSAGVNNVWLGHDMKLYFGMFGRPARIGRFHPAESRMELIGELGGHTVMRALRSPDNKIYFITYPATLGRVDMETGEIRDYGRLAPDALYVHGEMWLGDDGKFYAVAGQRPQRNVSVDLESGEIVELDAFPEDVQRLDQPELDYPDVSQIYQVQVEATEDRAEVTFGRLDGEDRRTIVYECSVVFRDTEAITLGPDGKIYGCASYANFAVDPATGEAERLDFVYNIYDYLAVGTNLYFGGYPNARHGVLDTARPLNVGAQKQIWYLTAPENNPRHLVELHNMVDTSDPEGQRVQQKMIWSLAEGADGNIYMGTSATRQNRGGALGIYDPETGEAQTLRLPYFKLLGIPAVCEIDGGAKIGIATWVSPDPRFPGEEPDEASIFIYDVEKEAIVHQDVPLPGCQVLTALIQAPGTNILVGLGLPEVVPSAEDDDAFSGNADLFFYDLDRMETVKSVSFDFPLNRRTGRPIAAAPDGSLWISGGGGILRVDAQGLTVEPIAQTGVSGNIIFVGETIYISGGPSLTYGDVSELLRPEE